MILKQSIFSVISHSKFRFLRNEIIAIRVANVRLFSRTDSIQDHCHRYCRISCGTYLLVVRGIASGLSSLVSDHNGVSSRRIRWPKDQDVLAVEEEFGQATENASPHRTDISFSSCS